MRLNSTILCLFTMILLTSIPSQAQELPGRVQVGEGLGFQENDILFIEAPGRRSEDGVVIHVLNRTEDGSRPLLEQDAAVSVEAMREALLKVEGGLSVGLSYPGLFFVRGSTGLEAFNERIGAGVEGLVYPLQGEEGRRWSTMPVGYAGYVRLRPLNWDSGTSTTEGGASYLVAGAGRIAIGGVGYSDLYRAGVGWASAPGTAERFRFEMGWMGTPDFSEDDVSSRNLYYVTIGGMDTVLELVR